MRIFTEHSIHYLLTPEEDQVVMLALNSYVEATLDPVARGILEQRGLIAGHTPSTPNTPFVGTTYVPIVTEPGDPIRVVSNAKKKPTPAMQKEAERIAAWGGGMLPTPQGDDTRARRDK